MTSNDRYKQYTMTHHPASNTLSFVDSAASPAHIADNRSASSGVEESKLILPHEVIEHKLAHARITSVDSREHKILCRQKRHFCITLKDDKTGKNRKLYFMTYDRMLEGASYILAAQGFEQRVSQYKVLKRLSTAESEIELKTVIHRVTREKFLLKQIPLGCSESIRTQMLQEVRVLQEATRTSDALGLIDLFEDEQNTYIVTKKPKQSLLQHLMESVEEDSRWFSESEVATLLSTIIDAVASLHRRGIVHRDICMEKISMRITKSNCAIFKIHGFENAIHLPHKKVLNTSTTQQPASINRGTAPEILNG